MALTGCSTPQPVPVPIRVQVDEYLLAPCPEAERPSRDKTFEQKRAAVIDVGAKLRICAAMHAGLVKAITPVLDRPVPLVDKPVEPVKPRKSWLPF